MVSRVGQLHASEEGLLRVQLEALKEAWRGGEGGLQVGDELAQRMRCRVIRRQRWRLDSACHRPKARLLARDALHQPTRVAEARSRGLHSKPGGANREATHEGQKHARERACSRRERGNHVREKDAQRAPAACASIAIRTEHAPSSTLHLARRLRIATQPSVPIERAQSGAVRARVKLDRVERAIKVADKSRRSSKAARRHLGRRYECDVEGGKRAEARRTTLPRSGCAGGRGLDDECGRGGVVVVMEGRAATHLLRTPTPARGRTRDGCHRRDLGRGDLGGRGIPRGAGNLRSLQGRRSRLRVTGRFDLVRAHQFLVVAPAPHCRAHVEERVRGRRSRTTETRLPERPRRTHSTAKGVAWIRPKWPPVVIEQSYCNQSAMPLSDACGTAHKSPSQRRAARGLVAMSDVSTRRVALANAAA